MSQAFAANARRRFHEMVSRDDEKIDLAAAALLVAAEEYAGLDVGRYVNTLDRFAELVKPRVKSVRSDHDIIAALNSTLFDELGFHGNVHKYYDPRNSYLNEVIDRRTGIPITLTVVYIEVASRIGFKVEGVGLPGHFIASHTSETGRVFIDPFHGGLLLGTAGCADLLARVSGGSAELNQDHLAVATKKQILVRILSNLVSIHSNGGDYRRAIGVIERILLITPDSATHERDLGLLLAAAGETGDALLHLERYLDIAPFATDAETVRARINSLYQNRARLN